MFFCLKLYFAVSFKLNEVLHVAKIDSKYCDVAPLSCIDLKLIQYILLEPCSFLLRGLFFQVIKLFLNLVTIFEKGVLFSVLLSK